MTDKQYPPLPKPAYNIRQPTRFRRAGEKTSLTVVFTADQMRAYVDADRAQRLAFTDEQCDVIVEALAHFYWSGVLQTPSRQKMMRKCIRDALEPSPVQGD